MPRISRWLLAAALTLPCLAAYGQEASPPKSIETDPAFKCGSVIEYMAVLRQVRGIPEAKVEQLEAEEAAAFLEVYNAQEPATDYKADVIVFVIGPEAGTITLVKDDRACIIRKPFPAEMMKGMLLFIHQKVGQKA